MKLKTYQAETLDTLRRFLEEASITGPKAAFATITAEPAQARRLGRLAKPYVPLDGLPQVPYVCLRLPTGGGKTVLGAHAVNVVRQAWTGRDTALVLWLVPTNTIRTQTVEALKNTRHPYRMALDADFGGNVRVFDIADFSHIRPQDIEQNCVVVVGTIQTLRVEKTEGRKVYDNHEELEPHFSGRPLTAPELERDAEGRVKFSFVNLLHMHRPIMIVDEAHNALTNLSREMQRRVNPSAIIELTATPRDEKGKLLNNILHSVSAQELKDEQMIKLPIMLTEHDSWQNAVNGAIARRAALAEAAKTDREGYIRPIVLFQAQPKDEEVTVAVLKQHLVEVERVPEDQIVIATGDQRGLDGINLFDPACPINYVITVEALKEGWDCSFAYVFCSVSRIRSAVAVEQLLGRVLRMPYAARRKNPELNRAYAHLADVTFGATAKALAEKLVSMGFEEDEAADNVEVVQPLFDDGDHDLFARRARPRPIFRHAVPSTPEVIAALEQARAHGVEVRQRPDGHVEFAIEGAVPVEVERHVAAALPEKDRQQLTEAVKTYRLTNRHLLSPAEQGEPFSVPQLMAEIQGQLEFADTDTFMELVEWSILNEPATLSAGEFAIHDTAATFRIDIEGRHVTYANAGEEGQGTLDVIVDGWTAEGLAIWLEQQVRRDFIHPNELLRWVRDLIQDLLRRPGMSIAALMRAKYILARKVKEKIERAYRERRAQAYQAFLFGPEAAPRIVPSHRFEFRHGMYADQRLQRLGRWRPNKHFLGPDRVPAFDGAEDGEEMRCAETLDGLKQVEFWVRNVAKHPSSFWLPLAQGRFYPDFVAKLKDGRLLVVEYKGALNIEADSNEKKTVGQLWERTGGGLFLWVEKDVDGRDMRRQMLHKLGED